MVKKKQKHKHIIHLTNSSVSIAHRATMTQRCEEPVSHLTSPVLTQHTCSCTHVLLHIHKQTSVPKLLTTCVCVLYMVKLGPVVQGRAAGAEMDGTHYFRQSSRPWPSTLPSTVSTQPENTHLPRPKKPPTTKNSLLLATGCNQKVFSLNNVSACQPLSLYTQ